MARRHWTKLAVAGAVVLLATTITLKLQSSAASATEVLVYKSPTCGCCSSWVDHLVAAGFEVVTQDVDDLSPIKASHGITPELVSCHTALIDGYVIEGHVPADVIQRLLEERPNISGLAVPGMPMGSPGMEGARKDPYQVISFDGNGNRFVYANR